MTEAGPAPVLAVVGLQAEARVAQGPGVVTVAGGGDVVRLSRLLDEVGDMVCGVISFGIAGGLAPGLKPGSVIVASGVEHQGTRWPVDPDWQGRLLAALPGALGGDLVGVDQAIADAGEKARLHARAGALAVDMESHAAAGFASRHGLPFAALRVVADPAERSLPQAALVGMRPDGTTDVGAVLRALIRRPADLPRLIRTARDAGAAFAALRRARTAAGTAFGCSPGGEMPKHGEPTRFASGRKSQAAS